MSAVKDPVCGMTISTDQGLTQTYHGRTVHFCSNLCQRSFLADPDRYLGSTESLGPVDPSSRRIAYFSMEVAIDPGIPTYSGGLGVLAGDTLRSCADLKIPVVGVSLLYWKGCFEQTLDQPMYYQSRDHWIDVMRHTIAFNASFFNTHRMVQQYAANAYV